MYLFIKPIRNFVKIKPVINPDGLIKKYNIAAKNIKLPTGYDISQLDIRHLRLKSVEIGGINRTVIAVRHRSKILIIDLKSNQLIDLISVSGDPHDHSLFIKDNYLAFVSNNDVILRDLTNFKVIATLKGHTSYIKCILIYKNILISSSQDSSIRIYSLKTFELLKVIKTFYVVHVMCVHNDILYCGSGTIIRIYGLNNYYRISNDKLNYSNNDIITSLNAWGVIKSIFVTGNDIIVTSDSQKLVFWNKDEVLNSKTKKFYKSIDINTVNPLMTAQGNYIFILGEKNSIDIIDIKSGEIVKKISSDHHQNDYKNEVVSLRVYKNFLLVGNKNGNIEIWAMN